MKKSMILVGMLSIGYAYAQEGKVGINIDRPSATLQVKSKTGVDNSTDNLELTNAEDKTLVKVTDLGNIGIRMKPEVDMDIRGIDGGNAELRLTRYTNFNNGANITIRRAGGTFDTPTVPQTGTSLGRYRVGSYVGNEKWDSFASMIETISAGEPTTNGNMPTTMYLSVTSSNGDRQHLTLQSGMKMGIGFAKNYDITERLEVNGNAKITGLKGSGNRNVYVDADGVLKAGSSADAEAGKVASTNAMQCNAANRGKMNFVPNDKGNDVFGICLRNEDGNYYWGYMVGGNNPTNGTGAFGSGL